MTIRLPGCRVLAALALATGPLHAGAFQAQAELAPRTPYAVGPVRAAPLPDDVDLLVRQIMGHQLTLKFVDEVRGRARPSGEVFSMAGATLAGVRELAARHGLQFEPLIDIDMERLTELQARAAARSGRAQPDLAGMLSVHVPGGQDDPALLEAVGQALQQLPEVEYAFIQTLGCPPPTDVAPETPDHTNLQTYFKPAMGMDVLQAHALGMRGAGVRISDCEYGWNADHEDLPTLHAEPGHTVHASVYVNGWDSHGTAVAGMTSAVENGMGCTGMAPDASFHTYPEWSLEGGYRRLSSIASALADSDGGDVVLLEMQTVAFGSDYGPAELDPSVHALCSLGVDAGVIVVAPAGDGKQNLDAPAYAVYRGWGDSGAILVGAGSASAGHNALSFSTYGSRVDLQGWGQSVFTLGYGNYAQYGGDKNQRYTSSFNGTSSAAAFVASAAALGSALVLDNTGSPVDPRELRQTLVATGTPQGQGGPIGPLPNLPAALEELGDIVQGTWSDLGSGLGGLIGTPRLAGSGPMTLGSQVTLQLDGGLPYGTTNLVIGLSSLDAPFKGGVLVPTPDILLTGLPMTLGSLLLSFAWPSAIPPGTSLVYQHWIADPSGPAGFTASNAVMGTSP